MNPAALDRTIIEYPDSTSNIERAISRFSIALIRVLSQSRDVNDSAFSLFLNLGVPVPMKLCSSHLERLVVNLIEEWMDAVIKTEDLDEVRGFAVFCDGTVMFVLANGLSPLSRVLVLLHLIGRMLVPETVPDDVRIVAYSRCRKSLPINLQNAERAADRWVIELLETCLIGKPGNLAACGAYSILNLMKSRRTKVTERLDSLRSAIYAHHSKRYLRMNKHPVLQLARGFLYLCSWPDPLEEVEGDSAHKHRNMICGVKHPLVLGMVVIPVIAALCLVVVVQD